MKCTTIEWVTQKQKLNTRSSTKAELIGVNDAATVVLWTKLFMESQVLQGDKLKKFWKIE